MRRIYQALLLIGLMVLAQACATARVGVVQEGPVAATKFDHIAVPPFSNEVGSSLPATAPENMARAVIAMLQKEQPTAFRGVSPTPSNQPTEVVVKGKILKYDPGSKVARFILIGLGAGTLELEVAFTNGATGETIEKFSTSGEIMAGGIVGASMGIEDMINSAAKQIVQRLVRYGSTDERNMGEVPRRISNLTPGSHEVQAPREGYEDFKQRFQVQPKEKQVLEANLKRFMLDEDRMIDKIFYFDDCAFGYDKFNHFVRFQKGGRLEGALRSTGGPAVVSKSSIDFNSLNGQWWIDKNKVIIDFQMLKGFSHRRVLKVVVDIGPDWKDVFPAKCESSTEYRLYGGGQQIYHWDGKTEIVNCQMREVR